MSENAAIRIDSSNEDQLKAWNGDQGAFWVARADRFDEGVARYHHQFLAAAAIEESANVLDIGCGSGQATRDAARRAISGAATGVDLSSGMIALARRLAEEEGVPNVDFQQADAQVHPFTAHHYDVAISRHGAMFFGDPEAAFTNIARALRPDGRLVLLTWQPTDRNEWVTTFRAIFSGDVEPPAPVGVPNPASLSDPEVIRSVLTSGGFADVRLHDLREPMYFGRSVEDAAEFVTDEFGWMMRDLDADAQARALDKLRTSMAEHHSDRGVFYDSAAWLIEARRR